MSANRFADVLLGPALFTLWWLSWSMVWWSIVRREERRPIALLAYELALVPLALVSVVAMSTGVITAVPATWPASAAVAVGVVSGILAWAVLTGWSNPLRLAAWPPGRRLIVGVGTNVWSAIGEEIAFRLLLLSGAVAVLPAPWA
ncbi:hypothetical protein [Rhodococcus sp. 14-2483-1-2]|uniref:hypothetical protein n=1 Tax=Rhodococcus sp. 14-2483-1-2 TaxID=2023147 RepID=UPI000B9A9C73|nr:hypothetical protein [Rhodococcus sp. 14-2483-1-2]OZF26174.1 hypothetical protein CH295_26525 [Rhodococcus sp. 14-2483-1-2]